MGFLRKILGAVNGNKTAIGGGVMLLGQVLGFDAAAVAPAVTDILTNAGGAIVSVGLVHKGIKSLFNVFKGGK